MNKIIIKNKTDLPIISVMKLVQECINGGRISNNNTQYCYVTSYQIDKQEYHLVSDLRKCSDVFTFYKTSRKNESK